MGITVIINFISSFPRHIVVIHIEGDLHLRAAAVHHVAVVIQKEFLLSHGVGGRPHLMGNGVLIQMVDLGIQQGLALEITHPFVVDQQFAGSSDFVSNGRADVIMGFVAVDKKDCCGDCLVKSISAEPLSSIFVTPISSS